MQDATFLLCCIEDWENWEPGAAVARVRTGMPIVLLHCWVYVIAYMARP